MKFGQPLLTTELSGSLGGVTASSARGSVNYFRVRRRPSNPRSTQQLTVRAALTQLSGYWAATLTAVQRAAWNAIASATASGFDQFIASNTLQLQAGNAVEPVAPVSLSLAWTDIPVATDFTIEHDGNDIIIRTTVNMTTLLATGKFLVYLQRRNQRPGWANRSSNFVFVGAVTSAASLMALTVPTDIAAGIAGTDATDEIYIKVRGVKDSGEFTEEIEMRKFFTEV